jgi:gamma-glutamyltranspeptidase/glutathione hydrolase
MFDDSLLIQGPKKVASGEKAMVATQHPEVTKAMLEVMKDGGNAVDATIMACLLQNVYEPHMSNHAGTIDFLYYDNTTGKSHFLNGVAELAEGLKPFAPNPHRTNVCTIPGFAPSLAELHKRFGTKEWSYYCQPAIKAAEEGTIMTSFKYACLYASRDARTYFPSSREFFYPNGFLVPVGHRWKRPDLAETLRRLAEEGPEYFITGEWAQHFVEMSNEIGWEITLDHLKAYEPRWMEPIKWTYNGHEMLGNPPPDLGGLVQAYVLGVLDEFDLKSMGHYTESAETLYTMAWMLKRARTELIELIRSPLNYKVPVDVFLSKEYHRLVAEILRQSKPIIDLTEDIRLKTSKAAVASSGLEPKEEEVDDSCHNVVCDPDGNWVTMMHTGNGGGVPGLVVDGVAMGGMSNNAVAAGPGRRRRSGNNPIMILDDNSEPLMVLGTPGMPVFSTPIVLTNIFGFGMDPNEAVDVPRFWWLVEETKKGVLYKVQVENRLSKETIAGLAKMGVQIESLGTYRWNMGSFQVIWKDKETGKLKGTSDPRRLGYAEGY